MTENDANIALSEDEADSNSQSEEPSETVDTETDEPLVINRREKPDIIQLKVGSNLRLLLGYEKMYDLGNGEQIKSRLIATQLEIIIMDNAM